MPDATDEVWKPVVGYEGLCEVSNNGRVKSTLTNKLKKPTNHHTGYEIVNLTKEKKCKNSYVHSLVAKAFLGLPDIGMVVNHKDKDTRNNALSNLEYVSSRENVVHGKSQHMRGTQLKSGNWQSQVKVDGKSKYLGVFSTKEEANNAYVAFLEKNGIKNKYAVRKETLNDRP